MTFLRTSLLIPMMLPLVAEAKTYIRIEGTTKSDNQIFDLMAGRLEHVRNDSASPSHADDAAFLLRQVLVKDGYAEVRVDWKVVSRTEILLTVHEGTRLSLGTVTLNGVEGDDVKKLEKLYALPAEKDRPLTIGDPPFREEDIATGLGNIVQQLNSQGHWDAKAELGSRTTEDSGKVSVVINVVPGPVFTIAPAKISSADGAGVDATKATADLSIAKQATTANLNTMRLAVEESFNSQGYPDAKITMGRTLEGTRFIPEFSITLGTRVRLNKVKVDGFQITNPARVEARLEDLEGDWYDAKEMNDRVRELLATGAFSSVRIETQPTGENQIDATLHLQEGKAKEVSVAAGADSYQGPIMRITYADRNLWGGLRGFSTGFEVSALGILGETKITDPWLFGSDVAGSARLFALIYGREGYKAFESGLEGKLTWKFGDHYSLELLAGQSVVNLSADGLPSSALGETVYTHPRIRATQSLDFRDSKVLPKNGWHIENPFEIGAAIGDLSTAYVSTGMSTGYYHKINNTYEIGLGGEAGILVPSGDGGDLPIDMRLFNGGPRSVRSFPNRELGPTIDGYPTGGEGMWNANVELIRTITGSVKGVVFFDAGSLASDYKDFGASEVELAAGLGVRLDLPIGPVRLEYGYNLTQDMHEPSGTIHFAIGMAY